MHHMVVITCIMTVTLAGAVSGGAGRLPDVKSLHAPNDVSCQPTATVDLLPDIVAPAMGRYPVWAVTDVQERSWQGDQVQTKILWIVAKDHPGDLVVTGQVRGGVTRARFSGRSDVADSVLRIIDATEGGVVPGDVSDSVTRRYAFHPSSALFVRRGCWKLHVSLGFDAQVITLDIPPEGN